MTEVFCKFRMPLALLLAAAILFTLCGCNFLYDEGKISEILGADDPTNSGTDDGRTESVFSLSYYTEEALDPYTASSRTNSELLHLCYSGLFSVDRSYSAVPVIAEGYEAEGNTVLIRLRADARFFDGTPVTASDCEASYNRAAKNDSVWSSDLSYIRSYKAVDDTTFQVVFRSFSPTQLNLLTVPIVKSGTEYMEYSVGCGRYRISPENGLDLIRVDCGIFSGTYAVDRISLLGIADREALIYNFNYGRLQAICADLSLGAAEYRSDSELITVPTNRFTFLAVNKSRKELADVNFSKGITYLLDRKALVSQACNSFATSVWYPLNPAWSETKKVELNPDICSVTSAGEAFAAAEFLLSDGQRLYHGKVVTLRILVNRENDGRVKAAEYVAESLRESGFAVEVFQATWDEYQTAVKNLDFDLYVGEVNLPSNLDLSALYSSDVCNTGEPGNPYEALQAEGNAVLNGTEEVQTFVSSFQNTLPFIPLYYSLDALAVNMDVIGDFGASVSEVYWGIENWSFAE